MFSTTPHTHIHLGLSTAIKLYFGIALESTEKSSDYSDLNNNQVSLFMITVGFNTIYTTGYLQVS